MSTRAKRRTTKHWAEDNAKLGKYLVGNGCTNQVTFLSSVITYVEALVIR